MTTLVNISFQPIGKLYHFDAAGIEDLQLGDMVVVETSRGEQLGHVKSIEREAQDPGGLKPIKRRATSADLALYQSWKIQEIEALECASRLAREIQPTLKIVDVEYSFDGKRLSVQYVSEGKVDTQALQRQLASTLHTHIDLRQVGPRDHAKSEGGYGCCGEPRCCSRFLTEFTPISIRMAKVQGVSLNPTEITGICGRLRCCLAYEQEQYVQACQSLPKRKSYVETPQGVGRVVDLLPMRGTVVVQIEDRRVEVPAEELKVVPKPTA